MSAFAALYGSGDDAALITITGLDHRAFRYILELYKPLYDSYTPYGTTTGGISLLHETHQGRPRSLDATQSLGLALAWTRTRGSESALCTIFGATATVGSLFIRFSLRILLHVLASDPNAAVNMPSVDVIREYQSAFRRKHSLLTDIFAVADGLKLYLQQSGDCITQNMFYNGWKHDHYVGNVLVFAPDGAIVACALNTPGCVHDSQISEWGNVYKKLASVYEVCGAKCVVDSAFAAGDYTFLVKSSQDYASAPSENERMYLQQATSARQCAEWGMRAFQGSFPRLKDRLIYEERGERMLILETSVLLFNLRARLVGVNQLLAVYMPELQRKIEDVL